MVKQTRWKKDEIVTIAKYIALNEGTLDSNTKKTLAKKLNRTESSISWKSSVLGFVSDNGQTAENYVNENDSIAQLQTKEKESEPKSESDFEVFVETLDLNDAVGVVKLTKKHLERALASLNAVGADSIGISIKKE